MNSFKNSCLIQLEKVARKIDSKMASKPAVIPTDETSFRLRADGLKDELKREKESEP
jgi:hypothetical protein